MSIGASNPSLSFATLSASNATNFIRDEEPLMGFDTVFTEGTAPRHCISS